MKRSDQTKRAARLRLSRRAFLWSFLLIAGFFFAQFYQNPISHVAFWGIVFFPLLPLLQLLLARAAIRMTFSLSTKQTEKGKPVTYRLTVKNRGLLPIPFVSGRLCTSDDSGLSVSEPEFRITIPPLSEEKLARTAVFAYRGRYPVGLERLALSDSLRLVTFYPRIRVSDEITVIPRRIAFPGGELGEGRQRETNRLFVPGATDTRPTSDTRLYHAGDRPQMIHWKLSSKADELLVREERPLIGQTVALFCMFPPEGEASEKEFLPAFAGHARQIAADRVAELALSAVGNFRDGEENFLLVYPDGDRVNVLPIGRDAGLADAFLAFGTAALPEKRVPPDALTAAVSDTEGYLPVFVMSEIDEEQVARLKGTALPLSADIRPTLLFAADLSPLCDPERRRRENGLLLAELTDAGFTVTDLTGSFSRMADRAD